MKTPKNRNIQIYTGIFLICAGIILTSLLVDAVNRAESENPFYHGLAALPCLCLFLLPILIGGTLLFAVFIDELAVLADRTGSKKREYLRRGYCSSCKQPLSWISANGRWYCYYCRRYY